MHILVGIAFKSLLVAALTMGLLQLLRLRAASERSWVAHMGLLALIVMAFAPLALPKWSVEAPAFFSPASVESAEPAARTLAAPRAAPAGAINGSASTVATITSDAPIATRQPTVNDSLWATVKSVSPANALTALYAIPAFVLLLITIVALARLVALQARAEVLVDSHWLGALARAQKRMGFKHGTALLTSDELASPISWGVMRPVILLNRRAVEATGEAEAIIAHELAHVARLDWLKLLLARIATALFWFNPLVWLLAREAHQLREEAADDSVLAADIVDTDYAQLLVAVARHDCPGWVLGAHGVAPSRNSLARRVARVLDSASVRGPAARPFALGVVTGALAFAAPLAALTLTPAQVAPEPGAASPRQGAASLSDIAPSEPADLPRIIAQGVSASVTTAVAAAKAAAIDEAPTKDRYFHVESANGALVEGHDGTIITSAPSGATVTFYPPSGDGRRKVVARGPSGSVATTFVDADEIARIVSHAQRDDARATRSKANALTGIGVTPEYVNGLRAAVPHLARLEFEDFAGMRAVGVTPDYARDLVAAGFPTLSADELVGARAVGLTGAYVQAMRAAGINGDLDEFVQLRAVGIDPGFAVRMKSAGIKVRHADDLIEMRMMGDVVPPSAPKAPVPPRPPKAPDPDG